MLEVLAPIGSIQALRAAINAGADAVYLGLELFNARIKADNFTKDNIRQYVEYCHLFGVKVYVTFNTSIKNSEMQIFEKYVDIAAKANVDAFIVTDLGTLNIFKKYDIPLHGSTQIGVHNLAGAKVLEELGFSRVVLARETLLEDIVKIKKNTRLEIEYFVHGALCVCFSGSCLMSSMMSGDSGNRGRCNQPCRLKYSSSFSDEEKYLLSPKDQCLIDKVEELYRAGVDSLKIEGRLKQAHYVGNVVGEYRKAVDNILFDKKDKIDYSALKRAYNRGNFTNGYNYENSKEIIYDKVNGNIGEEIGEIVGYYSGGLKIKSNSGLNTGDGVKIIRNGKELGGFSINCIKRYASDEYIVETTRKFEIGSKVCLTSEKSQVDRYNTICPKLSIKFILTSFIGKKMTLKAICGDTEVEVQGDLVDQARSYGATKESIAEQLLRLGDSEFSSSIDDIDFIRNEEEHCFIPQSKLNSIRRDAVENLRNKIIADFENKKDRVVYEGVKSILNSSNLTLEGGKLFVEIDADEQSVKVVEVIESKINLC
ncbi:MAG: U32 family peptidase [Clostridia bacterium]|nr:U32 family peptidase [Clostridia bacterium]